MSNNDLKPPTRRHRCYCNHRLNGTVWTSANWLWRSSFWLVPIFTIVPFSDNKDSVSVFWNGGGCCHPLISAIRSHQKAGTTDSVTLGHCLANILVLMPFSCHDFKLRMIFFGQTCLQEPSQLVQLRNVFTCSRKTKFCFRLIRISNK